MEIGHLLSKLNYKDIFLYFLFFEISFKVEIIKIYIHYNKWNLTKRITMGQV